MELKTNNFYLVHAISRIKNSRIVGYPIILIACNTL